MTTLEEFFDTFVSEVLQEIFEYKMKVFSTYLSLEQLAKEVEDPESTFESLKDTISQMKF